MSSPPVTVVAALAELLRRQPGRPFVTVYDDDSGERVELSVATVDNWVTKVANLFTSEWDLQPGDRVAIAVPVPWQQIAAVMGAWTAGLTVTVAPVADAAAALTGWDELAAEIQAQPDVLLLPRTVAASTDALLDGDGVATQADLMAGGIRAATLMGLAPGGRLLTDLLPADRGGLEATLLAPLATRSSAVLLLHATARRRATVAEQERCTCVHWSAG